MAGEENSGAIVYFASLQLSLPQRTEYLVLIFFESRGQCSLLHLGCWQALMMNLT
jgi:hypothetical protein